MPSVWHLRFYMLPYANQYRREVQGTLERAEALMALAAEQGFDYLLVLGQIMAGWTRAEQGQGAEGMTQIRQGLTAIRVAGAEIVRPYFLALLLEAHRKAGQTEEGLKVVAQALSEGDETGQRYYEAELYRLKGELLLAQAVNNCTVAESCFHQAIESPEINKPNPSNSEPPPALPNCGNAKESARKPMTCWHRCMDGLRKGLIRLI